MTPHADPGVNAWAREKQSLLALTNPIESSGGFLLLVTPGASPAAIGPTGAAVQPAMGNQVSVGDDRFHVIFGTTNGSRYLRVSIALASASPGKVSFWGSNFNVRPSR